MSKPWGGTSIGSWAAEAERAEAEDHDFEPTLPTPIQTNPQSFPTLKESISTKPKKKKMSLSEFHGSSGGGPHSRSAIGGPTRDDVIRLPTGPQPRSNDDFYGSGGPRLGGGFPSYGDDRRGGGGPPPPRRTGGFNCDDDRRGGGPPPPRESHVPSRADEVDNWASAKRAFVPAPDSGRGSSGPGRYGSLGGGSRADEVDNWSLGKKVVTPGVGPTRGGGGSGFRDTGSDWRSGGGKVSYEPPVLDPKTKPNPFGAARPREQVLEEKGLDWKKLDMEVEVKKVGSSSGGSRPTSSHGSRPTSSHSNMSENFGLGGGGGGGEIEVKITRPKVNPFGDAKPREVLLEEKGLDWKKMDLELEHRRIDRPETEEEKALKEEIDNLKKKLEKEAGDDIEQEYGGEETSLRDLIQVKEKDLETLIKELDDKARFGQKAVERPGSGAGRRASYPDRPPSQSGIVDGARGVEFMDRPRSRGTGDVWTRPGEDRRGGFQGSRDRGFMNNRDFDRSRPRERW